MDGEHKNMPFALLKPQANPSYELKGLPARNQIIQMQQDFDFAQIS